MIGAIIGDYCGSMYERENEKSKNIILDPIGSQPTDDSILTIAVGNALVESYDEKTDEFDFSELEKNVVDEMRYFGTMKINSGFGGTFIRWLLSNDPKPYGSFGNGAAMRVSACGIVAKNVEEAEKLAEIVTKVTHNHPSAIKAAKAIAVLIFMAKQQDASIDKMKNYIQENYYDMNYCLDDIRDSYEFNVSCDGSVPHAIKAFFESSDSEDAIRNAISIGGDSDTIAAIAGSIAIPYYEHIIDPEENWICDNECSYIWDIVWMNWLSENEKMAVKEVYKIARNRGAY